MDLATFEKFQFNSKEELEKKIRELGCELELAKDFQALKRSFKIKGHEVPNAIAILPMEGCDGMPDGSPSELTFRRYRRFSEGGAGLIWYEACAVVSEGRANPLQLAINKGNVEAFHRLVQTSGIAAEKANGYRPVTILQLTHSGRYSRPFDNGAPMIPQHDPLLDPKVGITENYPVITDAYLDRLQEHYVEAALLAKEAGFDGVDIKACHRYLVSEILASHTRKGKYGGSFENRSRFLLETINKVKKAVGEDFIVAVRFSVYDAHPYPYGFGVDKENEWQADLTEPLRLVKELVKSGVSLLSNSAGNPYYRFPQVTRPFDQPTINGDIPREHPLKSIERLFEFTRKIQEAAGDVPVIGNGYSWLRQFIPYFGAKNLELGYCKMIGLGREAFAYPDAARDMLVKGELDPQKCCIACSKCTQIMRDHGKTGCVIRDSEIYLPLYKEAREAGQ